MFGDSDSYEGQSEKGKEPAGEEGDGSGTFSRWLAVIALLLFFLIYLPLRSHPWGWFVAIAISYSVAVLALALDSALNWSDADDFFGDSRTPKYLAMLLLPHALVMVPIMSGAFMWLHLQPSLPHWVTDEGRKGSVWDVCGLLLVSIAAIVESTSLGNWMKRRVISVAD